MSEFENVADYLPETVKIMVELVGFVAVEKIIKHFGGSTFYFFERHRYFDKLKSVIGSETAKTLCQHFGGVEKVYIPRCEVALRLLRNQRFITEFDRLCNEEKLSHRMAMIELCPRFGFSDRCGWEILKKARNPIATQGGLFD